MTFTEYRKGKDGAMTPIGKSGSAVPQPKTDGQQPAEIPSEPKRRMLKAPGFRRGVRMLQAVLGLYLLFYIVLAGWVAVSLRHVPAHTSSADTAGNVWLLVGTDSRAGLSAKERKQLKTGKDEGSQRADSIMLVYSGAAGTTIVSLPRDSYVKIPAHTATDGTEVAVRHDKINSAYSYGGAKLLVATVEQNTGLHIDHYMEVGFIGIRDLTNAAGGVDMCIKKDYRDKNSGLNVKKGCQTLDGKTALAYVRMRYADPTGDIGRVQRQQQYVSAMLHSVATPSTLLNPFKMARIAQAGVSSLHTGDGDGVIDTLRFASAMRGVASGKAQLTTVPIANPDGHSEVGSVVIWDDAKAAKFFAKLGAVND